MYTRLTPANLPTMPPVTCRSPTRPNATQSSAATQSVSDAARGQHQVSASQDTPRGTQTDTFEAPKKSPQQSVTTNDSTPPALDNTPAAPSALEELAARIPLPFVYTPVFLLFHLDDVLLSSVGSDDARRRLSNGYRWFGSLHDAMKR